ncbi:MAG: two-component system response regulator [Wenzhouxiangellaceae bacterium]|nr:two-component system response regulator [Wenzhouxiangellaceae bacterium]
MPQSATLLVVDDVPENLALLGESLAEDFRVRVANSGARALEVADSDPRPDLILLDIMMPEMDGYEVLARLKRNPRTAEIPVIFVTAMDALEDERRGLELGAVDYITKPIRPAIVQARVRNHLALKRARDQLREHNRDLEAEVQRRIHQIEVTRQVGMHALASLAETRDDETGQHIMRTQGYVRVLAEHLATQPAWQDYITPEWVRLVADAAPLHDIGKVGIPDHILLKPGKLTPEEWAVMQTHADLGARAIERAIRSQSIEDQAPLKFMQIAVDLARHHHEKWDGSGYPAGLAGRDIPLPARLMTIADVFDALISRRVYKPAFPIDKSLAIIHEGRGTHFDPELVDALDACIDTITAIARRHADPEPDADPAHASAPAS